ncbi:MAG: aldo/keto reductase [Pseudomonadales bacterium]|nr:aldo/keto reductase [Pseudomonadales bacterium]
MTIIGEHDRREVAGTGIRVSPIGLGTVKFGRNAGVKYPQAFELPDDRTLSQLMETAAELGINLIDTAPAYGTSESRVGKLLASRRDEWIVMTKVGETWENGRSTFDFSREATHRSIERSLSRLATDRLDIVLVHASDDDVRVVQETDVLESLSRLKERGVIGAIGVSTKTLEGARAALSHSDLVMAAYSPADTSQREALDLARELGKSVLVKKALASGHATDPGASLAFALSHPAVASAIVGTINPAHLESNVRAALRALRAR